MSAPHRPSEGQLRRGEALWGARPPTPSSVKILRWAPGRNSAGTVVGYIDAELPSGLTIHSMKLMRGPNGGFWIAMPAVQATDRDGNPVVNADGKAIWNHFVDFSTKDVRRRFQDQIIDALRRAHPEAFGDGAP